MSTALRSEIRPEEHVHQADLVTDIMGELNERLELPRTSATSLFRG